MYFFGRTGFNATSCSVPTVGMHQGKGKKLRRVHPASLTPAYWAGDSCADLEPLGSARPLPRELCVTQLHTPRAPAASVHGRGWGFRRWQRLDRAVGGWRLLCLLVFVPTAAYLCYHPIALKGQLTSSLPVGSPSGPWTMTSTPEQPEGSLRHRWCWKPSRGLPVGPGTCLPLQHHPPPPLLFPPPWVAPPPPWVAPPHAFRQDVIRGPARLASMPLLMMLDGYMSPFRLQVL